MVLKENTATWAFLCACQQKDALTTTKDAGIWLVDRGIGSSPQRLEQKDGLTVVDDVDNRPTKGKVVLGTRRRLPKELNSSKY